MRRANTETLLGSLWYLSASPFCGDRFLSACLLYPDHHRGCFGKSDELSYCSKKRKPREESGGYYVARTSLSPFLSTDPLWPLEKHLPSCWEHAGHKSCCGVQELSCREMQTSVNKCKQLILQCKFLLWGKKNLTWVFIHIVFSTTDVSSSVTFSW